MSVSTVKQAQDLTIVNVPNQKERYMNRQKILV